MLALTLFEALFITHFVMDWVFQTEWEAMNKSKKWSALCVHCFIYTIGFIPVFFVYEVNFLWLVFIFISHIILDQRKFLMWWMEKVKRFNVQTTSESLKLILLIGVDQTFHILVLAIITLLV
jgi:hypothetical protein